MRGGAQRAHEAARAADAFHVDQDALRAAVAGQVVQHLRQLDRGVGPQRHHGGEADAMLARPVEHGGGERARLRDQRQRAGRRQRPQRAGVELEARALQAQAVGPQQVDAVAARRLVQLVALRRRQAAAQHQRGAAADAADDLHCRRAVLRPQRDERQVGARAGQVRQGAGHRNVEPGDGTGKATAGQRLAQHAGLARGRLGVGVAGKDDQRARVEQGVQVVAVHGGTAGWWAGGGSQAMPGQAASIGQRPPCGHDLQQACVGAGRGCIPAAERHRPWHDARPWPNPSAPRPMS